MRKVYGDLHIHVGRAGGRPVKITASRNLTLQSIIYEDAPRKGLDMVGIVDSGSTLVANELEQMLNDGHLQEHPRGGFMASNGVLVIAGCEVESRERVHSIIFLPFFKSIKYYQKYMKSRVTNKELSTQKANTSIPDLVNLSCLLEGIFCPAHAFTPHKGVYGACTDRLSRILGRDINQVKAIELGLSADTDMADMIAETRSFTFLSNSDAHSSPNVGREYNLFRMADKNFEELRCCLENKEGRRVLANYGMDPLLGKYHRSFCPSCSTITTNSPPVTACSSCGSRRGIVKGVYDRIVEIKDYDEPHHPVGRPVYNYRVPLKDLPGVGPRTLQKLAGLLSTEINIMEKASFDDLKRVAGQDIAAQIIAMRSGRLDIIPGGGGYYGKVKKNYRNN